MARRKFEVEILTTEDLTQFEGMSLERVEFPEEFLMSHDDMGGNRDDYESSSDDDGDDDLFKGLLLRGY